jgi:hypothetical protein
MIRMQAQLTSHTGSFLFCLLQLCLLSFQEIVSAGPSFPDFADRKFGADHERF